MVPRMLAVADQRVKAAVATVAAAAEAAVAAAAADAVVDHGSPGSRSPPVRSSREWRWAQPWTE